MSLATALALLLATIACARSEGSSATRAAPSSAPAAPAYCQTVPLGRSFCEALEVDAPKAKLRLAVANTDELRELGLMGVRDVPADEGMIFVFPDAANANRQFWMKDTLVALDMVFVSAGGTITEVASNVAASKPGQSDSTVAKRNGVGRYVIELRAGGASVAGLEPGTRLVVPSIPAH